MKDMVLFVYYFKFYTENVSVYLFVLSVSFDTAKYSPLLYFLFTFFLTVHTLEWTSH